MNTAPAENNTAFFLLARIGADCYALPAACVLEIVALGNITPLPFAPAWVSGLANLGGRILPLLNPAQLLGINTPGGNDVILVATPQSPCALRVTEVLARIGVEKDALRHIESGEGLVVAEFEHAGKPVLVINPAMLGNLLVIDAMPAGDAGLLGEMEISAAHHEFDEHAQACLVFLIGDARYAMPLADVGEVIAAPASTPLPGTPTMVAGIGMLRDSPLLMVSAASLLDVSAAAPAAALVIGDSTLRIGLLVDRVLAVERIPASRLHALDDDQGDIVAVAHDDAGHITSLLARNRLLGAQRRQLFLPLAPADRQQHTTVRRVTRAYLETQIGEERFGIPLDDVQRIVNWCAPEAIDSQGGRAVGAINVDGNIVPVLDPRLLQPRALTDATGAWILVGEGSDTWAVAVSEARRIVQVPVDDIESLGSDNAYLQGIANIDSQLLSLVSFRARAGECSP